MVYYVNDFMKIVVFGSTTVSLLTVQYKQNLFVMEACPLNRQSPKENPENKAGKIIV